MKKDLVRMGLWMKRNSPTVLTGISVAGLISTTVMAVKATPKALLLLENAEYEKGEDLTKKEIVQTTYKCYLPAVAMGTITIASIISANSINLKRQAAIASAYTVAKEGFKEYQDKVIETFGEKKEQTVRDEVAQEKLNKNPIENNQVLITGDGDVQFFDPFIGRYFESNMEKVRQVQNNLNHELINCMWVSLNEFYDALGLDRVRLGDEVGWNADDLIELKFSSMIATNGKPCVVMDYDTEPFTSYQNYYGS